jgi:hypothetical protein
MTITARIIREYGLRQLTCQCGCGGDRDIAVIHARQAAAAGQVEDPRQQSGAACRVQRGELRDDVAGE